MSALRSRLTPHLSLTALLSALLLALTLGCDEQADTLSAFQEVSPSAQMQGVDLGKFDQASTISLWQLKESADEVLLEGLNADNERLFGAIMKAEPTDQVARLTLLGDAQCELSVNLAQMSVVSSNCSEADTDRLEQAAEQLLGTLAIALQEGEAAKADGLFSKITCVAAGVGATLISLVVWQFASSVAIAGASVSTLVPILTAGGTVLGAVGLCYNAFAGDSELSTCVKDCDGELMCVDSCVDVAMFAQRRVEESDRAVFAAEQLLQCVGSCDGVSECAERCETLMDELGN